MEWKTPYHIILSLNLIKGYRPVISNRKKDKFKGDSL